MKVTLKLQRYGMNMSEATILEWFKKPGESFLTGDPLYSVETEKVNEEFVAQAPGRMLEISVREGEDATIGQALCIVDYELSK
jgi:pyruvate/2-oxoglutarate dehydrogenase complex dihydrolipoamide acyltransferase (E2) component